MRWDEASCGGVSGCRWRCRGLVRPMGGFLARPGDGRPFRRTGSCGRESRGKYSALHAAAHRDSPGRRRCAPGVGCCDRSLPGGLACRRCRPEALCGGVAAFGGKLVAGYPQGSDGNIDESHSVQTSYPQKPLDNRSVNVRIHSGRIEDICGSPDRRPKLFHTAQNCARVLRTVMNRLSP